MKNVFFIGRIFFNKIKASTNGVEPGTAGFINDEG